ncbi:hypothetical protein DSL72_004626 [Monilinia vaccinii-corymbosi]|uniref:Arp2/3 complex 41 kDa subunit n=1 Tax=Monilinia vaccinii-corymbosi TaxID=61207 RepID=A0A8A3P499_9HELO|nr:hypothetical protein DSL72_004626 [Monilinia vaccinii-corymbosi]
MPGPEVHQLFHHPIADHSFSADRQTLAVARDTSVELYERAGNGFKLKDELKGHDKTVTSVDIAPNSGRIVTCSQDRNALVWEPSPTGYKPTLVLLRINRAATFVRWSPSETKFAVGSGARVIAICYFEEENDWWVSKHIKKPIRSTITTVAWHPNSVLLAAGSTDAHARVFSSFIKGVDARPEPGVWGERLPFNTVCGEYLNNSAGWVHAVSFSPSGNALAFAAHDSSITVVYPNGADQPPKAVVSVSTQLLPFMSLIWSGEAEIIAAGYDCEAFRFGGNEGGWQLIGSLESKGGPVKDVGEESAFNMFKQMDLKGKVKDDTQLTTVHQNTISTIRVYEGSDSGVSKFTKAPSLPPIKILSGAMKFNNDEQYGSFRTTRMESLPYSRNSGGIRHGSNNPVHLSGRGIPYSSVTSDSGIATVAKNANVEGERVENRASHGYASHETPSNIDLTIDPAPDCLMTNPASSQHQSKSAPGTDTDYFSGNRLPSIAMMLNGSPSDRASIHPKGKYAFPTSAPDSRSSLSNTSDGIIVGPVSMPQQRSFLLNTLYQICLDATTTCIRALPQSSHTSLRWELRHSYSNRYHPYRGMAQERSYNDGQSKTLMDNVKVISTFLWRKARRDEMVPHRAESDAVMDMNNLCKWGENLVGGMEERAGDEEARMAVLHAAMAMCGWLRVSEASTFF